MAGLRVIARGQYPCENHFIIMGVHFSMPVSREAHGGNREFRESSHPGSAQFPIPSPAYHPAHGVGKSELPYSH